MPAATTLRARTALGGAAALLALSGLAGAATAADPAATPLPDDPDTVILRIEDVGGVVIPGYDLVRVPHFVLYADGRLFQLGAQIAIYPAPLLPPLLVGTLTDAQILEVLAMAEDAGLASGKDTVYGPGMVADAPDALFSIWGPDGVTRTQFGAFGIEQTFPDPAEAKARADAQAFIDRLVMLPVADAAPYVPSAFRLLVMPYPDLGEEPGEEPVAWPGTTSLATGGEVLFPDYPESGSCVVITGDEAAALWPELQGANELTPFVSDGAEYRIVVRPLLPGEPETCSLAAI